MSNKRVNPFKLKLHLLECEADEKDNKISDLEAKLAESEKQRQHLKDWLDNEILTSVDSESYYATINEYEEEVKKLKQRLEESESELVLAKNTSINTNKMEILHLQIENEELKQSIKEERENMQQLYSHLGVEAFSEDIQEQAVKEIAKLKQQLAESEHRNKQLVDALNGEVFINYKLPMENAQLKQQLAEKDEQLRAKIGNMKSNDFIKMCLQCGLMIDAKEKDQDKILFTIEQLEKVKEFCNNPKNRVEYEYCPNAWTYAVDKDKLMLEIDNQINQLKEKN